MMGSKDGRKPEKKVPVPQTMPTMMEIIANDRLGQKVRVKCL